MSQTRQPDGPRASRTVSLERLGELLDAYGAAPERWPEAERAAAEDLVRRSPDARARMEQATALDRLLDAVPVVEPSPALVAQVLGAAPRSHPARAWRRALAVALPLAAAATVVLWLASERTEVQRTTTVPVVAIGEYTSPTDVLLGSYGIDVSNTLPSVGCSDSELGCPNVNPARKPYSQGRILGRLRA